ncbi:putative sulfite reductase-associated electron transfer protein DsrP [Desulfonauticus submarinus]|uniref:Putative sulfite reductase-associated electron transfer protein DsrP n=1 Tax=Desulfonauticus submarinus TaxID=206665 RepID=A0A1H0CJW2_9BACT|nr:NrfD/PsrC family molybdoenzyme membrane anchor subunit [Desulfonauticus submarinus]SDN58146.1 putative sulfite reductase-associated electron transfer protein DsrP [Desulfonauticus submarinus]
MLDKAIKGSKLYWGWIGLLLAGVAIGFFAYTFQMREGLSITGMSRDVSWGFYIAQFTFLVGVAASAVMMVIPKYLHHYQPFARVLILGEFLAVAAVSMCLLFIVVDLGQPQRMLNVLLHPTPGSILFWDMIVLNGYLFLNILIGWVTLQAEHKGVEPPKWIKPFIYISIPWAVSIHTVTAFLYCGLPGRHFWLTAILAPRFLASAFASGPAFLILLCYIVKIFTKWDPGKEAIQSLAKIVTYATIINLFFVALEVFTAFYSNIPGHMIHLKYLFVGLDGHSTYVAWMWVAMLAGLGAFFILLFPQNRQSDNVLAIACLLVFLGCWIDKGLGMIAGGFTPNPLEEIVEYAPTKLELLVTFGVYCAGFLILTILYKVAIGVKKEVEG